MDIDGKTKILGVIGNPISHTASPAMHNAAIRELDLNYVYVPIYVPSTEDLNALMDTVRASNFGGINVTVPYKGEVISYLDEIDETAEMLSAVNTIVNENGKLKGYNTDADGFIYALKKEGNYNPNGKSAAIFGAGGAARAIVYALCKAGVLGVVLIELPDRLHLAESLRKDLQKLFPNVSFSTLSNTTGLINAENELLSQKELIINATPLGMEPEVNSAPISEFDWINKNHFIYDIIYKPAETLLMKEAKKRDAKVLGGAGMLVGQGVLAFKLFTGQEINYEIMRKEV